MYEEFSKIYTVDDDGFEGSCFGYYVTTDQENIENWLLKNVNDDGSIVKAVRDTTSDIFVLKNLNVDDDYQGQGYGKQILEEIMDYADAPVILISDILESQRESFVLETFYQNQGFETVYYAHNYPLMATEDIALDLKDRIEQNLSTENKPENNSKRRIKP